MSNFDHLIPAESTERATVILKHMLTMLLNAIKSCRSLRPAIIIAHILLCFGCSNSQKLNVIQDDDVTVIRLSNLSEDNLVELSSLVKDVKVVALEPSPECLIGDVKRMELSDSLC